MKNYTQEFDDFAKQGSLVRIFFPKKEIYKPPVVFVVTNMDYINEILNNPNRTLVYAVGLETMGTVSVKRSEINNETIGLFLGSIMVNESNLAVYPSPHRVLLCEKGVYIVNSCFVYLLGHTSPFVRVAGKLK